MKGELMSHRNDQDKLLADRVVALGVGHKGTSGKDWYSTGVEIPSLHSYEFVRNWRVAGALMEKCYDKEIDLSTHTGIAAHNGENWVGLTSNDKDWTTSIGDSLPRAIIEATVEVLERV